LTLVAAAVIWRWG